MKTVTLTADAELLEKAHLSAAKEHRTLNAAFGEWLERYAGSRMRPGDFDALMKQLAHVEAGRPFTRDERNER